MELLTRQPTMRRDNATLGNTFAGRPEQSLFDMTGLDHAPKQAQ
jgi:hypothetical protein